MADMIEFYHLFMKDYVYWGSPEKSLKLLIELLKLSVIGLVASVFLNFNQILIIIVWFIILQRSKFIAILLNAIKRVSKEKLGKMFGPKWAVEAPLDQLIAELSQEDNAFAQYLFNPFGIIKREE